MRVFPLTPIASSLNADSTHIYIHIMIAGVMLHHCCLYLSEIPYDGHSEQTEEFGIST